MGRLKIAVLGLGKIAKKHLGNIGGRADLVLVARSFEKAQAFKREVSLSNAEIRTYSELCSSRDIHGIVICTPPEQHAQQVKDLWTTGASLLVEKPLCISFRELSMIGEVQAKPVKASQFLMIGENYYYKPSTIFLRQKIRSGALGKVHRIFVSKGTQHFESDWRKNYGALLEGGVHYVALLHDLVDAAGVEGPREMSFALKIGEGTRVERESRTIISIGSLRAELDYSWCRPALLKGFFQWSRVEGDRGSICFETNGILEASLRFLPGLPLRLNLTDIAGFRGLMDDYLQCLEEGKSPYSNFERARRDLEVPFAAYEQNGLLSTGCLSEPSPGQR